MVYLEGNYESKKTIARLKNSAIGKTIKECPNINFIDLEWMMDKVKKDISEIECRCYFHLHLKSMLMDELLSIKYVYNFKLN